MIGDNWCVSCLRVIPPHQFLRTRCDACIDEIERKLESEERLRRAEASERR